MGLTGTYICIHMDILGDFPKLGVLSSGSHNKGFSILGSTLGSPHLGKLPYIYICIYIYIHIYIYCLGLRQIDGYIDRHPFEGRMLEGGSWG